MRSLIPGGLRLRLVLAICAVTMATVAASFAALHQATSANLRDRIDRELNDQYSEFRQEVLDSGAASDPTALEKASKRFVSSQRYHPEARIFAIAIDGSPQVTNEREIVEREIEDGAAERDESENESANSEDGAGGGIIDAPDGRTTVSTEETGRLRVLSVPIEVDGTRAGTFRVADPLNSVDEALQGLRNTFIAVGLGALLLSVTIAIWLANLISRPLRRMAGVASAVDSGDLSHRIDYSGDDEVGVLAEAFNHMLDRLEAGFRRQREFVADASHELRSPLTVLRGRIELLTQKAGNPDAITAEADGLLREVRRMDRLISDMLTLARAERGALIERRPVSIEDFAADLRRDLPLLGPRSYSVESSVKGTLDADPDRLAQVVRNVVANAVRHTPPDGHIDVSIGSSDGEAVFAISDDGAGIEPERLARIFDRFYRTDEGRGREQGGSGLGLAIARAIVEAHGGSIAAESQPGEGATIRFRIPGFNPAG